MSQTLLSVYNGIKTTETLYSARSKCPTLTVVPVHFDLYQKYSKKLFNFYETYTDQVEPFGLDECWMDVTHSQHLFGTGEQIANEIRESVRRKFGITVSIGVSFNKIWAKLGSDYKKPDAVTVIMRDNYKDIVWPLPVSELLYVGGATKEKLASMGIHTIGQLAQLDPKHTKPVLHSAGHLLWYFANGLDTQPVASVASPRHTEKTIGNSRTTPYDLITDDAIRIVLYQMSESVAARMRDGGFICRTIQLNTRDKYLVWNQRQAPMRYPCQDSGAIFAVDHKLYKENKSGVPIRNIGVRVCNLVKEGVAQLSFLKKSVLFKNMNRLNAP